MNNTFKFKSAKDEVVAYLGKLEQTNIIFNTSFTSTNVTNCFSGYFSNQDILRKLLSRQWEQIKTLCEREYKTVSGDWPLVLDIVHIHGIDSSQTLFYFVPQNSDSHSQACSTTQAHGEEIIGIVQCIVVHTWGG